MRRTMVAVVAALAAAGCRGGGNEVSYKTADGKFSWSMGRAWKNTYDGASGKDFEYRNDMGELVGRLKVNSLGRVDLTEAGKRLERQVKQSDPRAGLEAHVTEEDVPIHEVIGVGKSTRGETMVHHAVVVSAGADVYTMEFLGHPQAHDDFRQLIEEMRVRD